MNGWNSWVTGLGSSFHDIWSGFAYYGVQIVLALILVIIGLLIASLLDQLVTSLVRATRVDAVIRKTGAERYFSRAGIRLDIGKFIGSVVKWFVILVVLIQALSMLSLDAVTAFLQNILHYLPNVFVAVLILIAGIVIGEAMNKVVVSGAKAAQLGRVHLLGSVTRWAIWLFAVIVALYQLGIAAVFSETVFTALVAALALAFGLAFGLGGQQAAAEIIGEIRHNISDRHQQ